MTPSDLCLTKLQSHFDQRRKVVVLFVVRFLAKVLSVLLCKSDIFNLEMFGFKSDETKLFQCLSVICSRNFL
jgi:hypothetical protein